MPSDTQGSATDVFRLGIDIRRLAWGRRLAWDYAFSFEAVAPFFAGNPSDRSAWKSAIHRAQRHPRARTELADVLDAQLTRRGAPPESLAQAGRLREADTVAVVTGQQAGLFGGPLFTLLKALTALSLSDRLRREHGIPVVAIFWIDAEDHDWAEVATCGVLDRGLALRPITLPAPPGAGHLRVADIHLDASITAAVDALAEALAPTEFTPGLLRDLRAIYRPGAGMTEAFGRWMDQLLGPRGLVVFDASDPAAKPLVRRVFLRELDQPGYSARLASEAGRRLVERGYHAQVTPLDGTVSLFHLDGGRQPIRTVDGQTTVGETPVALEALRAAADRDPQRFSPNVLLRPVVQDTLFPTVAYVAGPSELAYLAQLRPVYEHFGVPMPMIYPRATATILDSAAARFLTRYDIALESLQPRDEAALNRLLEAQLPAAVEQAYQEADATIRRQMTALMAAVPAIDPTLDGAARSTLGKMQHDLETLHDKIIHAAKRRDATLRRQFGRTQAQSFPEGHRQERAVGFVYFLNRYGPALVDRLTEALPLDLGRHWVVAI